MTLYVFLISFLCALCVSAANNGVNRRNGNLVGGDGEFGYELLTDGRGCFWIEVEYKRDCDNVVVSLCMSFSSLFSVPIVSPQQTMMLMNELESWRQTE